VKDVVEGTKNVAKENGMQGTFRSKRASGQLFDMSEQFELKLMGRQGHLSS
jgi:hypothetical protein